MVSVLVLVFVSVQVVVVVSVLVFHFVSQCISVEVIFFVLVVVTVWALHVLGAGGYPPASSEVGGGGRAKVSLVAATALARASNGQKLRIMKAKECCAGKTSATRLGAKNMSNARDGQHVEKEKFGKRGTYSCSQVWQGYGAQAQRHTRVAIEQVRRWRPDDNRES
jgi:hypothetical protein